MGEKNRQDSADVDEWMNAIIKLQTNPEEMLNKSKSMMRVFDNLEENGEFEYAYPIVSRPLKIYVSITTDTQPEDPQSDTELKNELGERMFNQLVQIRKAQWEDKLLRPLMQYKLNKFDREWSNEERDEIRDETLKYELVYGLLYFICHHEGDKLKLVVPEPYRAPLMQEFHITVTGSHLGKRKAYQRLKLRHYWPTMMSDIYRYCTNCTVCNHCEEKTTQNEGAQTLPIPIAPFRWVTIDILEGLTKSQSGNVAMLIMVDLLSRWPEVVPIPNRKVETIARAFMNGIVARNSMPEVIVSDTGSKFTVDTFERMATYIGAEAHKVLTYQPQKDDHVKRMNAGLTKMLKKFVHEQKNDWDQHL
jgi:hypothetical protein